MIPEIIHQTWKTELIPKQWRGFVDKVKLLNPGWEYRLWTDMDNEEFVKKNYPDLFDVFKGFSRNIMRADVIRYLIMDKIGGVYLDLDYEVIKPFEFEDQIVVLPLNRSIQFGDEKDELGNCIFASVPGHKFWRDVINELIDNPPTVTNYSQIFDATGPLFLTRMYNKYNYPDISTPDRIIFHPPTPKRKKDIPGIKANGVSVGIHHPWGSWKERFTLTHIKLKYKSIRKDQLNR